MTGERHDFTDKTSFLDFDSKDRIYVGHNFLAFDAVALNRLWGTRIGVSRVVDTFVLSQLYNPSYPKPIGLKGKRGPHSLEAWGIRLGFPKMDFHEFSVFTPEMLTYCRQDTALTRRLFVALSKRMSQVGFSEDGCEIEHQAWNIIQNKQKKNGFPLDKMKAELLYTELRQREDELKSEIFKLWPPQYECVASFARARKKDGDFSAGYLRHIGQYPELRIDEFNGYDAYDWVEFNLGSPKQRIEKLLELGWQPVNFTKKTDKGGGGSPKVDEDSLVAFAESSGHTEALALSKWIVVNSRANMIRTWLDAYDEQTRAIHGSVFIASTLRYRHANPNTANIPAVRHEKDDDGVEHVRYGEDGFWTYEARDLWTSGSDEFVLVGIDGTGIQNRCLIHNLIKTVGEERVRPFTELGLSGDIHRHNIAVLGLANKAAAKKFYYTLMMGGQGKRLAADQLQFGTRMTAEEGKRKRDMMIDSIPGFGELIKDLTNALERTGRIVLCDGTPILVPSPHMVIPYLLQGDESRLMKRAMIYVDQEVHRQRLGTHVYKVADIHDEWQYKVRKGYEERFINLALPCFPKAGESFRYRISITGDAKIGRTWAETH